MPPELQIRNNFIRHLPLNHWSFFFFFLGGGGVLKAKGLFLCRANCDTLVVFQNKSNKSANKKMHEKIPSMQKVKYKSTKEGKDQELKQSSTTSDQGYQGYQWKSNKLTIGHHKLSQEVSPFPAGDHKATANRRARKHSKHTPKIT